MMSNINRDYLIINDVKKSNIKLDNGSMFFYITDKNTQNIFVNLVINISNNDLIQKYANIENAEDYTLTMNIVKPDNTYKIVEGKLHDKEKAIFEFDLKEDCCDEVGTYKCELLTKCNINDHEEITTSNKLTYKVKSSVLNDLDDIVEAPEYPLVIQLFDKLSDIEQYEEDRRANEVARQLAEERRQTRFNALDDDMVDRVNAMDSKMDDVEARISAKEQAVDKLINDTKADIDEYKVAKDTEIDEYKIAKDQQINEAITNQDNKIDTAIAEQNNRIETVETNDNTQNTRLNALEAKATTHEARITATEAKDTEQDSRLDVAENRLANIGNDITNTMQPIIDDHTSRLDAIEAINVSQGTRLDAIEIKNQQQDDRLLDVEKVNKRQDMDLKCLFAVSKNNMIDVTEEGNSIYLQNSTVGYTLIDEIQGNTMVNCNKEPDKEIILNGNINTQGYSNVTLTEGVDGGKVDVALEGNTLVNVCDQKDPVAITKSYTVETGNHVALQGEYDGKCRPVVYGNTLWIDNDTEEVLTAFDDTKNLRLQSSFEDNLVTQEMVDSGEELAENLGKYRVEYKVTGKNKFDINKLIEACSNKSTINITTNNNNSFTIQSTSIYSSNILVDFGLDMSKQYSIKYDNSNNAFVITQVENGFNFYINPNYNNTIVNLQIEEGDTATSYEPYKEYKKTFYLNSPLLEGDTIEQQGDKVVHVHRSEIRAYQTDDELTLPTDMINTLVAKATPQYEVISQNDTILCDSYTNGHLDVDSAVPIEKVVFKNIGVNCKYLYPFTKYTIQFESDNNSLLELLVIGGNSIVSRQSITKGINKISITTDSITNNSLWFTGIGFNASNIVVTEATDQDFGYFEGMKSVGECEELEVVSSNTDNTLSNTQTLTHEPLRSVGDIKDRYVLIDGKWYIERNCGVRAYQEGDIDNYITDMINTVYPLSTPTYEPIDYNPFTVYSNITHISNNSTIPCNMTIKNTGYNCLLKPSTTYTISSNLGLNTVTTPSTLTEDCLRFMDTDTSDVTTMRDVLVLEGDWTTKPDLIPSNFSGIESCFEQELVTDENDEYYGKYKVNAKVVGKNLCDITKRLQNKYINNKTYNYSITNHNSYDIIIVSIKTPDKITLSINSGTFSIGRWEDANGNLIKGVDETYGKINTTLTPPKANCVLKICINKNNINNNIQIELGDTATEYEPYKESNVTFYINEPLRGIGNVKDKVYVKNDKVVVERNCGVRAYQDGDFGTYLTDKVNTVYQLAEPVYEEVEYNDVKLFIESFKNSTLFYNSNVPVTSKVHYSYSVPIVDTVAQTASISDEQDQLIIDLATQVAVLEMMTM